MKLNTLIIVTFILIFVNQILLSNELEFSGSFFSRNDNLFIDSSLTIRYDKEHNLYTGIRIPVYYRNNQSLESTLSPADGMRVGVGMSSRYISLGKLRNHGEFGLLHYITHKGDIAKSFAVVPVTLGNPISVLFRIPDRSLVSWDIKPEGKLFSFSFLQHLSSMTLGMFIYRFTSWEYSKTPYTQSGGHGLISYKKESHLFYLRGGISLSTLQLSSGYFLRGDYRFTKAPWGISCFVQGNNRSFTMPNGKAIDSSIHAELSVTYAAIFSLFGEFVYRPMQLLSPSYKKIHGSGSVSIPLLLQHRGTVEYQFLYISKGEWNTNISHRGEISYTIDRESWKILSSFELTHYPLEYQNKYIGKVEYQLQSEPWTVQCYVGYNFSSNRINFSGKIVYEKDRRRFSFVVDEDKKISLVFLWKL